MDLSFYKHALIDLVVALLLFACGAYVGARWQAGQTAKDQLAVANANIKALNDAFNEYQTTLQKQRLKDQEVIHGYENEIAQIKQHADNARADSLRLPASVCDQNTVPAATSGANGADKATSGTVALPERVTEDLRRLAREADEVTAQCRSALNWISK